MNAKEGLQYLYNRDAILIDTETTGLTKTDEVIDLAVISFKTGQVLFNKQFLPTKKISPFATQKNGYSLEKLKILNAKPFYVYEKHLNIIFKDYPVIAYNVAFDKRLLEQTFLLYGMSINQSFSWHCAMNAYSKIMNVKERVKLENACANFSLEAGCHTALTDVIATRELLLNLKDL